VTIERFGRATTSDTDIVRAAGAAIGADGRVEAEWNSAALLVKTWQALSAYAHCRPWATLFDRQITGEPDEVSGLVTVTQTGNSERLLDDAFLCIRIVRSAIRRYQRLSSPR
jgi:hypothetical protein